MRSLAGFSKQTLGPFRNVYDALETFERRRTFRNARGVERVPSSRSRPPPSPFSQFCKTRYPAMIEQWLIGAAHAVAFCSGRSARNFSEVCGPGRSQTRVWTDRNVIDAFQESSFLIAGRNGAAGGRSRSAETEIRGFTVLVNGVKLEPVRVYREYGVRRAQARAGFSRTIERPK